MKSTLRPRTSCSPTLTTTRSASTFARRCDQLKEALAEVIKRRQAISEVAAQRRQHEGQIKTIDQEQSRICQNMAQLDRTSDLYARYVKKFGEQEDQVETLREQIAGLAKKEADLKKQLDAYVIGLTIG